MVILFAAVLAAQAQQPAAQTHQLATQTVAPVRQARAVVTIVAGEQLKFAEIEKNAPERLRETLIRTADGSIQPAKLVEFE